MDPDDSIGARIRRLRSESALTQRQLAEPRYTAAFVSTVEAGVRAPSTDALHHFAQRLGASYEELATGLPAEARVELGLRLAAAWQALFAGDRARAVRLCLEIEEEAHRLGFARLSARARLVHARAKLHSGNPEEAATLFASVEELLADAPLPLRVPAVSGRARCLSLCGDLRYAAHLLETTLEALHRGGLPDPAAVLLLHCGLVPAYARLGAPFRAARAAEEALALTPRTGDPERVGAMHLDVARTLVTQHRIDDAETSLASAFEAFHQVEMRAEIGWCHWARGYTLARERQLDAAAAELCLARDTLALSGTHRDIATVDTELAEVERWRGQDDSAREMLEHARQLIAGDPEWTVLARIHRQLGLVSQAQAQPSSAEAHFRHAIELCATTTGAHEQALTLRLLGDLLHEQGHLDDAARAYQEGLAALVPTPDNGREDLSQPGKVFTRAAASSDTLT